MFFDVSELTAMKEIAKVCFIQISAITDSGLRNFQIDGLQNSQLIIFLSIISQLMQIMNTIYHINLIDLMAILSHVQ